MDYTYRTYNLDSENILFINFAGKRWEPNLNEVLKKMDKLMTEGPPTHFATEVCKKKQLRLLLLAISIQEYNFHETGLEIIASAAVELK